MSVEIQTGGGVLLGDLGVPADRPLGVIVFAHGSGSSRLSPRNQMVAARLRERGLATLLMDLLTEQEEADERAGAELRFDVALLADRLVAAIDWLATDDTVAGSPVGCFGASTGAAGALIAAAWRRDEVRAVVSRGGRPDLAGESLGQVRAPTLFIVGGEDRQVIDLNERARAQITAEQQLEIVPGASHLFEEPGALEQVARLAGDWFVRHLRQP